MTQSTRKRRRKQKTPMALQLIQQCFRHSGRNKPGAKRGSRCLYRAASNSGEYDRGICVHYQNAEPGKVIFQSAS